MTNRRKRPPVNMPGMGDCETFPRVITGTNDPGYVEHEVLCPSCDGTGKELGEDIPCWACNGDGVIMEDNIGKRR